jgi:hypothetical protein
VRDRDSGKRQSSGTDDRAPQFALNSNVKVVFLSVVPWKQATVKVRSPGCVASGEFEEQYLPPSPTVVMFQV